MQVQGMSWLGTRTDRFEDMVAFAVGVLGMEAPLRAPGLAVFALPDGATFEIFAPKHPGGGHPPSGAVGGFEVADVEAGREELIAAGCEVGELQHGERVRWTYFRAPDGNMYEIYGP
jgi:catechol 2,3-dioxygenase-like lactoylglutathione lyase family enzyme